MSRKRQIEIWDTLRAKPGTGIQELAKRLQADPEEVWEVVSDPEFSKRLAGTKTAHVEQLRNMHRVAMEAIIDILHTSEDNQHRENLAKWMLTYSTQNILAVSSADAERGEEGAVVLQQIIGNDPFRKR